MDETLDSKQASEYLGISIRMVQYYTTNGRLKIHRKVGRGFLYSLEEVQRFKRSLK
jgi:excisionase family DNA binding protein